MAGFLFHVEHLWRTSGDDVALFRLQSANYAADLERRLLQ